MADQKDAAGLVLSTLESVLKAADTASAPVAVRASALGGTIFVRGLGADEWLDPESAKNRPPPEATDQQRRTWNWARWLCSETGERLVKPDDMAALDRLAKTPFQVISDVLTASGMYPSEGAAEKHS